MDAVTPILFTLFTFFIFGLMLLLIKLNMQKKKNLALFIQSELDKYVLIQKLEELSNELSVVKLSESDGFIKFISQSRDWAFEYIEEVQKALTEFDEEVAPRLEWANTFGRLAGDTVHTDTIKTISEAYRKLEEVLPKDNQTPNN
jgi:hypothetical protein